MIDPMNPTMPTDLLTVEQLQALRAICNIKKPAATAVATSHRAYLDLQLCGMLLDIEIKRRTEAAT